MTEPAKDRSPDLSAKDMKRFMEGIGVPFKCPCCGNDEMLFHTEERGRSYALLGLEREAPSIFGADVAWVVVLFCRKCGYLMPFIRSVISEWLEKNRVG
jgi:DNA-directed RNA polymerase subunit M/transcription elongation factor TFIIS